MTRAASGLYHGRGWTVAIGDDAEAEDALVASIHEGMHDRLQMTTAYGLLVDSLLQRGDPDALRAADSLQRGSSRVHEQFATWMSCIPARWDLDRLASAFPLYVRHLSSAQARVGSLTGDYQAMHATQAVARAAMQSPEAARLLSSDRPRGCELSRYHRPDWRLARLDEALTRRGWGPLASWSGPATTLEPERFAAESDPEWAELNHVTYEWCASLLAGEGCPTLPYDGHLPFAGSVHRERRTAQGDAVPASREGPPSQTVALFSVESETMEIGDRLPVRIHPAGTNPKVMLAGVGERRHLFLAIRPRARLAAQYDVDADWLTSVEHVALLRAQTDDGTVELLDVSGTDPVQLTTVAPVIVNASMTSLASPHVSRHWAPLLRPGRATVLADQRPSVNLPVWLASAERRLRYAVFGVETHAGWVRVLTFRVEDVNGGRSRTYLAPVSRLYATGLELMFAEAPDLRGRVISDVDLVDEPDVRASIAHLLLEERSFDFKAGDPWLSP